MATATTVPQVLVAPAIYCKCQYLQCCQV